MKKYLYMIFILPTLVLTGCSLIAGSDSQTPAEPENTPDFITEPTPAPTLEPTPTTAPEPEPTPEPTPTPTPEPTPEPPPPSFGFIDAHADTISRALLRDPGQQSLYRNNSLDVDFSRLSEFDAPVQVFVAWCSDRWVQTAFERTNYMFDFFEREIAKHSDLIEIALDLDDIRRIAGEGKISAILAIEGGEALEGKIENLDHFYNRGVRILAPTWNRENELGFGQATNSTLGLKPFGFEVIRRMDELGMILDVSHLNEAGFWDAHETSTRPYMASHSNAYSVMPHPRNLKDDQIMAIVERGGIIGFNMFPQIITSNSRATMGDIMAHFRHFIEVGAGNHIGLGCDFDGIPSMPRGITDVSSLNILAGELANEFDEDTSFRIMEGNFYEFFKRYFEG
ncbi:MAG: dipeptidase [Oscillospiraceae bacterium]|nr:dipeptidase [Oscillospiraceae bacterium]